MNDKYKLIFIGAAPSLAIGLGAGIAIGLFITQKKIENKYLELSNKEIAEAKRFYNTLYKKDEFETPESAAESLGLTVEVEDSETLMSDAVNAMKDYHGTEVVVKKGKNKEGKKTKVIKEVRLDSVSIDTEETPGGPVEVVHNIFADQPMIISEDGFDYAEEMANRDSNSPYIISKEEYFTNEPENDQVQFTYYGDDDVLVDEKQGVVPDSEFVVGDSNLLKFGHGSGDPHIVYIRNEGLEMDFEVVGSTGNYSEQVLGYIKHSEHRKSRKFGSDDD